MSDLLVVRGIDAVAAGKVLDAWATKREWVRSTATRDAWEPQELEINGRNAIAHMRGKHKAELAELVRKFAEYGGRVIHVMLHRRDHEQAEQDLGAWAEALTQRGIGRGRP